ncbi:MAG: hypothetical protein RIG27_14190 [Coleofasciculus sp. F4-SAH-05]
MDKPNELIQTPQPPLVEPKILQQLSEEVVLSPSYLVLMGMAGILSAIALLTNSIPILIGSMIIAPAFLPLSLVAFAPTGRTGRTGLVQCGGGFGGGGVWNHCFSQAESRYISGNGCSFSISPCCGGGCDRVYVT